MKEHIDLFVAEQQDAVRELCAALLRAPSINPPGNVVGPAVVLRDFFLAHGLSGEIVQVTAEKPNLVVTLESGSPGPHLIFNGHLDTISPGNQANWSVPIHDLSEAEGKFYGLGIGNMKAGVAALAFATVFLAKSLSHWSGKLTFTAVADETVFGPDGAEHLLAVRPQLGGDALLCAEGPGFMNLAVAEKGLLWVRIEAQGTPMQGMLSECGSSATARLVKVLAELDRLNDVSSQPPRDLPDLLASTENRGLKISVNLGAITGGQFISQSSERAVAEVDFRIPPGLTIASLESNIDSIVSAVPQVTWSRIKSWEANWTGSHQPISQSVAHACLRVTGRRPDAVVRLPASDAARWRRLGVPAVCFGPQPCLTTGIDDFVYRDDMLNCIKIYALAALAYLTPAVKVDAPAEQRVQP